MNYYLHKGKIYQFRTELNKQQYRLSDNEDEHESCFVSISEERATELSEAATAAIKTPTTPTTESLRQLAYTQQADQYLIAYIGYTIEGNTEKAEEQKALYIAKKTEIRELYPDETTTEDTIEEPAEESDVNLETE